MYRNSEHYADPTAGGALARISAEQRYAKRREYYRQQAIAKRKAEAKKHGSRHSTVRSAKSGLPTVSTRLPGSRHLRESRRCG